MSPGFEPPYRRLTHEETITASFDDRIASVWPWIRNFIARSCRTRPTREVANFGFDDLLQEVWIELHAKNDEFDPTKGNYYAFAKDLVTKLCSRIRDRSLTVELPRDSRYAERQYERLAERQAISPGRRETYHRIQGARVQFYLTTDSAVIVPVERADDDDEEDRPEPETRQSLVDSIGVLDPLQARVLGSLHGIWGQAKLTPQETADKLGIDVARVASLKRSAFRKIRRRLLESGHQAVFSEN